MSAGTFGFWDGTQCKRCLDAFVCRQFRGLDEKDIQDICDNLEMKIMRALPQNMRDLAAKFKSDGLFSCDKNAQLALLVNDALLKAEQKMARKENNESDF